MIERLMDHFAEGGLFTLIGAGLIAFGAILAAIAAITKEDYRGVRRRPRKAKPYNVEPVSPPSLGRHRFAGEPDEGTRRLYPTTNTARSRVVMYGAEGIESGDHPGTTRRVRQTEEANGEEGRSQNRERRQDEGRPQPYGKEGSAHAETRAAVRVFRNDVTGEIIMLDENGERIVFES